MVSLGGLVMPVAVMVAALVMEAVQKRIHPYIRPTTTSHASDRPGAPILATAFLPAAAGPPLAKRFRGRLPTDLRRTTLALSV